MKLANYVKFLRGTIQAYNQLRRKDPDTLYFVTETRESETGLLYLGNKLIAGGNGEISLNDLADIVIDTLETSSLLIYNTQTNKWEAKPVAEIVNSITEMAGATLEQAGQSGLVPSPAAGEQDLYLKGDATWGNPTLGLSATVANILSNVSEDYNNLHKIETKIINLENQQGNIEDLGDSYYIPTVENPTTIINEINNINEKLLWKNFNT